MNNVKQTVLTAFGRLTKNIAEEACYSASTFIFYEPKMPEKLKNKMNKSS